MIGRSLANKYILVHFEVKITIPQSTNRCSIRRESTVANGIARAVRGATGADVLEERNRVNVR